jgi:hypothetical protein
MSCSRVTPTQCNGSLHRLRIARTCESLSLSLPNTTITLAQSVIAASLKGVWYRGHYLHDGSVASLEEMFNPERLNDTHVPGGYNPPGVKTRAIKGHKFGLKLNAEERAQLIAFLRTL